MNAYPFLDNKLQPLSDAELGDIVPPVRRDRIIDISSSPFVSASELRSKLEHLLMVGELDSGLPILRQGVLTGLIPAPDLEYALDTLGDEEENIVCLMAMDASSAVCDSDSEEAIQEDFTRYIDPVSLPRFDYEYSVGTDASRPPLPSISIPPSTWSTNALPSLACATSAFSRTANMLAWYTRRDS